MVIQKDTTINEIIHAHPESIKFFNDLHMSCGSCFAVNFDTLENGALMHGLDVNRLIDQLNNFLRTRPPSSPVQPR
ncbi:MAG: DUF1858 domain-containing protein [Nitrospinaceae bacterium]|jgi:hybrid cluster-associated redox disulfide protein|nr:MAG: DUF1858 domain-containing protein [Nitrospinaceae bacterium]